MNHPSPSRSGLPGRGFASRRDILLLKERYAWMTHSGSRCTSRKVWRQRHLTFIGIGIGMVVNSILPLPNDFAFLRPLLWLVFIIIGSIFIMNSSGWTFYSGAQAGQKPKSINHPDWNKQTTKNIDNKSWSRKKPKKLLAKLAKNLAFSFFSETPDEKANH